MAGENAISDISSPQDIRVVLFINGQQVHAPLLALLKSIQEQIDGLPPPTDVAAVIDAAAAKTTPADADKFGLVDSAAGDILKSLSWGDAKAALDAYFDPQYAPISHTHSVNQMATWNLLSPANGDYTLIQKAERAMTVTSVVTQSASGSATFTFKIDGVSLGGSANSVSTSEQSQSHSTANVLPIGGKLTLTVSSNSACQKAAIQVNYTETIP